VPVAMIELREQRDMPCTDEPAEGPGKRSERKSTSGPTAQAVAHAQHLVDSRPPGPYQLAWCQEAMHVGDIAVAAIALSGRAESGSPDARIARR
jgi:hypothetical protein